MNRRVSTFRFSGTNLKTRGAPKINADEAAMVRQEVTLSSIAIKAMLIENIVNIVYTKIFGDFMSVKSVSTPAC
jgi:hypothetical protein